MVRKRRRSTGRSWDSFMSDPTDGLEINSLNHARFIGRRSSRMSMFDADNIAVETFGTKRGYHKVSIMGEVRHANGSRSKCTNRCKDKTNGE